MLEDIQAFNKKFEIPMLPSPGFLSDEDMARRLNFQMEELMETAVAAGFYFDAPQGKFLRNSRPDTTRELPEILDGLVDQVYVALGTAAMMGFFEDTRTPHYFDDTGRLHYKKLFAVAWDRVHSANLKKEKVLGSWKVQKPEGWKRPNLEDLCE